MRIFVSSTFEDLREHRAAAIRVLRQLGHEVIAMEDLVAGGAVPLNKVLEDVKRCDVYVGIFAWRYGFVPKRNKSSAVTPKLPGAQSGNTSITHYEYLQAKANGKEILAFLLDESSPWAPHLIDGFATSDPLAPKDNSAIRNLRNELRLERLISYFTSPADLEARVSAAVTIAGMSKQVRLNLVMVGPPISSVPDSDPFGGIRSAIQNGGQQRVLQIELNTTWWSTRLYLTAFLAERLTSVRRLVIVRGTQFVGLLSTSAIISTLPGVQPTLGRIHNRLFGRRSEITVVDEELNAVFKLWEDVFGKTEPKSKVDVTEDLLLRWFGEAMLCQPVRIKDLAVASVVDLLRILDYPNDFVPVVSTQIVSSTTPPTEPLVVVDKAALNSQLAQNYVVELMDRARIG